MVPSPAANPVRIIIDPADEPGNLAPVSFWMGRVIASVSEFSLYLAGIVSGAVDAVGSGIYHICSLFDPDTPQPPDGAECSVCLDGFQNAAEAAILPGCATPTWMHSECLSHYAQNRIANPITQDEINGTGIACPVCHDDGAHSISVNSLGSLISTVEGQLMLQDFHLQSQLRIFARDPYSPLLGPAVTKNATCSSCQRRYFVNLRDPEQVVIHCTGWPVDSRNSGVTACSRVFCAGCEASPHHGMSCDESRVREAGAWLMDLNAKLNMYQMARNDDRRFRPCPKCDNLIERTAGCNHIQRTGVHADENVPMDPGWCDHNLCFGCLRDWDEAQGVVMRDSMGRQRYHDFQCNDVRNRQRVYAGKMAHIQQEIRILEADSESEPASTTCCGILSKCFRSSEPR